MKFPNIEGATSGDEKSSSRSLGLSREASLARMESMKQLKAANLPDKVVKGKNIKFHPCSPGQILQMAKILGVQPSKEPHLLPIIRRAVLAPFPEDWAVGHDQMGEVYYYNKFSSKVITVHPLSDHFLSMIDDAREREREERARQEAAEEEPVARDEGDCWMKFGTTEGDTEYFYNFETNLLHTASQYRHIIDTQLEDRRIQVQKGDDPVNQKMMAELANKKALQKMFATGVKKAFLSWTLFMMKERQEQADKLSKLTVVAGRSQGQTFKEWKEKAEKLAFVRRAMGPLGVNRTKGFMRDCFKAWHQVVVESIEDAKEGVFLRMNFEAWKNKCVKSLHKKRAQEILRYFVQGGSLSMNFLAWLDIVQEKQHNEHEKLEKACIKIQRRVRERIRKRAENKAQQNQRKQMKYHLLRVGEGMQSTVDLYRKSLFEDSPEYGDPPDKKKKESKDEEEIVDRTRSLAVLMLQGALEEASNDDERARLRAVVRNAKAKRTIRPEEEGYGVASVRDEVTRVVDILGPVDKVHLRVLLQDLDNEAFRASQMEENEGTDKSGAIRSMLVAASARLGDLIEKMIRKQAKKALLQGKEDIEVDSEEFGRLQAIAAKAKAFIDTKLHPESHSATIGEDDMVQEHETDVLEDLDNALEKFLTQIDKAKAESEKW